MYTLTVCVPSARLCTAINRSFRRFSIEAKAYSKPPTRAKGVTRPRRIEHLPSPIEPATKAWLWFELPDGMKAGDFLKSTFLDEEFVRDVSRQAKDEDDGFALECIVASSCALPLTAQFSMMSAPNVLLRAAKAEGLNKAHRHLAEQVLGIPSLLALMTEFAEQLIATATCTKGVDLTTA